MSAIRSKGSRKSPTCAGDGWDVRRLFSRARVGEDAKKVAGERPLNPCPPHPKTGGAPPQDSGCSTARFNRRRKVPQCRVFSWFMSKLYSQWGVPCDKGGSLDFPRVRGTSQHHLSLIRIHHNNIYKAVIGDEKTHHIGGVRVVCLLLLQQHEYRRYVIHPLNKKAKNLGPWRRTRSAAAGLQRDAVDAP